ELVLEPSGVKEDAKNVVGEFADLVAIHEQLIDAKEQKAHLSRLPELSESIAESKMALDKLQLQKNHLSVYFGEALAMLWASKLSELEEELASLERSIARAETEENDAQESVEKRHEEYLNLGGD